MQRTDIAALGNELIITGIMDWQLNKYYSSNTNGFLLKAGQVWRANDPNIKARQISGIFVTDKSYVDYICDGADHAESTVDWYTWVINVGAWVSYRTPVSAFR